MLLLLGSVGGIQSTDIETCMTELNGKGVILCFTRSLALRVLSVGPAKHGPTRFARHHQQ